MRPLNHEDYLVAAHDLAKPARILSSKGGYCLMSVRILRIRQVGGVGVLTQIGLRRAYFDVGIKSSQKVFEIKI